MRPLSSEEARTFLKVASEVGDRFEPLYVLAITTGLRRGELLGAPLGCHGFGARCVTSGTRTGA